MKNKDLSIFIGNSSVNKTLCNSLEPIGATQAIKENGMLDKDMLRYEKRKMLKETMDDYYRWFINDSLNGFATDWKPLFEAMKKAKSDAKNQKELKKLQEEKRKEILDCYSKKANCKDILKSNLFKGEMIAKIIPQYIKNNPDYTEEEKKEKLEVVKLFGKFTTAFTPFFKNRKNVFTNKGIETSITYRIVHDNAGIFMDNMTAFERINRDMDSVIVSIEQENSELLAGHSLSDIFNTDFFNNVLIQEGIDYYNEVAGVINQYVNLHCQHTKTNSNLYKMVRLKKQILSIVKQGFMLPEQFKNDREVYDSINIFFNHLQNEDIKNRLEKLQSSYNEYDIKTIYVPSKAYSAISIYLTKEAGGDWGTLEYCMKQYYKQNINIGKKSQAVIEKKVEEKIEEKVKEDKYKSLAEINQIMADFSGLENIRDAREYICSAAEHIAELDISCLEYNENINLIEDENEIQKIKRKLDVVQNIYRWAKTFFIEETVEKDSRFYSELNSITAELECIVSLYNNVRNYVTKKPYSIVKKRLYFGLPTLATGWSWSEKVGYQYKSVLFIQKDLFYLGVLTSMSNTIKKVIKGEEKRISESDYQKIVYSTIKSRNLVSMFLKEGNGIYKPSEYILQGYKAGKYKKEKNFDIEYCYALIDYFKACIEKSPNWKKYNFKFSDTKQYTDIKEFYNEVEEQGYTISFTYISESDINRLVDEGSMYLFKINNRDFAKGATGTDNLHTMYLKNLFSEENLRDMILKLNGSAELFIREVGIKQPFTHKAGSILVNKTYKAEDGTSINIPDKIYKELCDHLNDKTKKIFDVEKEISDEAKKYLYKCNYREATHDIVKDKRYTKDKYLFHVPITINFKAPKSENVNSLALRYIAQTKNVNVIGIDRGERNLIYVSVLDRYGNILKDSKGVPLQKSYNIVNGQNYQDKLHKKESVRQDARKNWKEIGKIKDLKAGYLSQVIHEITQMVIDYNAIIVMEDLNYGFKRGRFKIERQVYQKFETMLIDKMQYLVDKHKKVDEDGGLLRGYQMCYKPNDMKGLKQCGMIFYVPAGFTSKIDPTTGFADVFNHNAFTTLVKKKEFLLLFDEIKYDAKRDMFKFTFDYGNFPTYQTKLARTKWEVYTNGERVKYVKNEKEYKTYIPTDIIKDALNDVKVNFNDEHNLINDIRQMDEKEYARVINSIQYAFQLAIKLRNSKSETDNYDRIISPVLNFKGVFFDSANACAENEPIDADANGAYNIALKGTYLIRQIQKNWIEGENFSNSDLKISNETWFDYIQNRRFEE